MLAFLLPAYGVCFNQTTGPALSWIVISRIVVFVKQCISWLMIEWHLDVVVADVVVVCVGMWVEGFWHVGGYNCAFT